MINKFFTGLGIFSYPTDVGGSKSSANVQNTQLGADASIIVDHLIKSQLANTNAQLSTNNDSSDAKSMLPRQIGTIGNEKNVAAVKSPVKFVPNVNPQILSKFSTPAPFETLFSNFDIKAYPFYNFWTADETENDKEDIGNRNLEDVPRFIKVSWIPAPTLFNQKRLGGQKNHKFRDIRDVRLGGEIEKKFSISIKGTTFTPDHMQPENFKTVCSNLANGFMFPGILHAVTEIPVQNVASERPLIDEDMFLDDDKLSGVSINELLANVLNASTNMVGVDFENIHLMNDKYSFVTDNNKIELKSLESSTPMLSINSSISKSKEQVSKNAVNTISDSISNIDYANKEKSQRIKTCFVNPSITGILLDKKLNLITEPHHAENIIAISHMLPKLEILNQSNILDTGRKQDIPSYPAPPGLYPFEYVGYVLEKYMQRNNTFELVETIYLPDIEYNSFIDCKITYGTVYRYRIRVISRWTRSIEENSSREKLLGHTAHTATKKMSAYESSYFAGEWSKNVAYTTVIDTVPPPSPDELVVRPESSKKRTVITFRLPHNPQRDISSMRILRKLQDSFGRDVSDWKQLQRYDSVDRKIDFAPQNVLYYDYDVDFFQKNGLRYVYSAQCATRHGEISVLSEQLAVRFNIDYVFRNEMPVEFVSCAGVKLEHFGAFSTYPYRSTKTELKITENEKIIMFGRNAAGSRTLNDSTYILRAESLDTGQKSDVKINISFYNQKPKTKLLNVGAYLTSVSNTKQNDKKQEYQNIEKQSETIDKSI